MLANVVTFNCKVHTAYMKLDVQPRERFAPGLLELAWRNLTTN